MLGVFWNPQEFLLKMTTEIFKIYASWAEKLTKTRVSFLMTPTVIPVSRTEKKEKSPRGIRLIMHYFILFVIVYKRHFEQKHKRGSRKVLRRIFKFKIISAGANVIHECGLPKLGSSGICIQLEPTKNMSSKSQQSSRAQVWITRMLQDVAAGVLAEVRSCFLLLN